MSRVVDMTGERFGRLVVIKRVMPSSKDGYAMWLCQCDCKKMKIIKGGSLRSGDTNSCGCLHIERFLTHGEGSQKHGLSREFMIWQGMKARCINPNTESYKYYGARGITVCDSWIDSYETFLADMGRCPKGMTINRLNNFKDYSPSNCKWSTWKEQQCNRRNNIWIEIDGKKMVKSNWIDKLGISRGMWKYWKNKLGLTEEETLRYFMAKEATV